MSEELTELPKPECGLGGVSSRGERSALPVQLLKTKTKTKTKTRKKNYYRVNP